MKLILTHKSRDGNMLKTSKCSVLLSRYAAKHCLEKCVGAHLAGASQLDQFWTQKRKNKTMLSPNSHPPQLGFFSLHHSCVLVRCFYLSLGGCGLGDNILDCCCWETPSRAIDRGMLAAVWQNEKCSGLEGCDTRRSPEWTVLDQSEVILIISSLIKER